MLTVKHIWPDGSEAVLECSRVEFYRANPDNPADRDKVEYRSEAGDGNWDSGWVYVMNDKGRTVADYNLGLIKNEAPASQSLA